MAKKVFTDESLGTLISEIKSYTDEKVSTKANSSHSHSISNITNLQTTLDGKSNTNHTHNYAGSSSAGGSANSAVKLDTTTAGNANQPVYFSGGKPVAIGYTIEKSVPSNALFTDTNNKVTQNNNTENKDFRLILSNDVNDNNETNVVRKSVNFRANPSTGELHSKKFKVDEAVTLEYDSTNKCLNFVFS